MIIWIFFGLAVVAAAARIIVRFWFTKKLRLDDYLLLISCASLTAATGVLYYGTSSIFLGSELALDPISVTQSGINEGDVIRKVEQISKINWVYLTLSWVTIFMIKFGFLALFRLLVNCLPRIYAFWKAVTAFTTLVFAFAVCDTFIACPKMGLAAGGSFSAVIKNGSMLISEQPSVHPILKH